MNRSMRMILARQTVEIVERGWYRTAAGREVDIATSVRDCLDNTRYFRSEDMSRLRKEVVGRKSHRASPSFEVANETTLSGIARLLREDSGPVVALNFASARNPGGGFLNGSDAQEESLARSSALYASQLRAGEFYEHHRAARSPLYSDAMIWSPGCPIFRDDDGRLLDTPHVASIISSPAPNAGTIATTRPKELARIPELLRRRSEYVLALAASQGYTRLVLGAWGCGVFRNDPAVVAGAFMGHLKRGTWSERFDRVVFSVLDTSPAKATLSAFAREVG